MLDRFFLSAAAAAAICVPAVAQDGVKILDKTAQTVKDLKSLSLSTKLSNSAGSVTADITTDIDVKMLRDEAGQWMVRYSGTAKGLGTAGDESGELLVEVFNDGSAMTWIDYTAQKVQIRRARIARGPEIQMAQYGTQILDELRAEEPFAEAIGGADVTVTGQENIGGVQCDVVKVVNPGTDITQLWSIARSDSIPRKLVTGIPQMGETTIVVSNVTLDPELTRAQLEIDPPPNFEVVDRGPNRVVRAGQDGPAPRKRGTEVGNLAPDFELSNAEGESVRLENLQPNVVVLNFWGSWCLPCHDANDELQKVAEDYEGKPVKVVSLAAKEADPANAISMMERNDWTFELLIDADKTARLYQVRRYPTILVVGREGEVLHAVKGYKSDEDPFPAIRKAIDEHLAKKPEDKPMPVDKPDHGQRDDGTTTTTGPGGTTTGGG